MNIQKVTCFEKTGKGEATQQTGEERKWTGVESAEGAYCMHLISSVCKMWRNKPFPAGPALVKVSKIFL